MKSEIATDELTSEQMIIKIIIIPDIYLASPLERLYGCFVFHGAPTLLLIAPG